MPTLGSKHNITPQTPGQTPGQLGEVDQLQQNVETVARSKAADVVSEPYAQKKKGGAAVAGHSEAPVIDVSKFKFSSNEAEMLLLSMQEKMSEKQMEGAAKSIQGRAKQQKAMHEQRIKKMEEQMQKQQQANTGALVAKIFGWIGAALALVGGVLGAIFSAGTAAAASAIVIVAAIATIGMMAMEESGGFDAMMEGASPQAKMGVKMGIMAALMVLNVAGMVMSGGASAASEVGEVAEMAEEATEAATMVAETVEETTEAASDIATAATDLTEGVTDVTEGVTDATEGIVDTTESVTETAEEIEPAAEESGKEVSDAAVKAEKGISRTSKLSKYAMKAKKVTDAAAAADMVAGGSAQIASSTFQYDASKDEADARSLKAKLLKMESYEDEDRKRMQEIMESLDSAMLAVIHSIASTDDTLSKAISHMKAKTTA